MSDDPNRITNLSTTLRAFEGVRLNVDGTEIDIQFVPLPSTKRGRLSISAPKRVKIERLFYEPDDEPTGAA